MPGCSSGLGSHMNSYKMVPKTQGTGKRGLLPCSALAEQNSAAGNLADIFFFATRMATIGAEEKPCLNESKETLGRYQLE